MIICDPNDKFTQDDVNQYLTDIKELLSEAGKNGTLDQVERELCKNDLYYLGLFIFGIQKMYSEDVDGETYFHPWIFNRCREVEADPNYNIDIWAREHFKSTIITFLLSVHDILNNPSVTIGIISYNQGMAQTFVKQIRQGLENPRLRELFPDIIPNGTKQGVYSFIDEYGNRNEKKYKWSDEGFEVIRKEGSNKENTCSGYGLVTGQPTGHHFDILVYDDTVTPDSVRTQAQCDKTLEQWQNSLNCGSGEGAIYRIVGTRYHMYDPYFHMMNPMYKTQHIMGGSRFKLRIKPARLEDGTTVLYTPEYIKNKQNTMVGFVFAAQIMCDPRVSSSFMFDPEWLIYEDADTIYQEKERCNWTIICDPANTQNKHSDYTAMVVVGRRDDGKYIVADAVYDRLVLSQRLNELFRLVQKWTTNERMPMVWYEQSGLSTDIEQIRMKQKELRYYFPLTAATTVPRMKIDNRALPSGMKMKEARILALEPLFRQGMIIFADKIPYRTVEGKEVDIISRFTEEEYSRWPFSDHDDFFDALCRIADGETGASMVPPVSRALVKAVVGAIRREVDPFALPKDHFIPF